MHRGGHRARAERCARGPATRAGTELRGPRERARLSGLGPRDAVSRVGAGGGRRAARRSQARRPTGSSGLNPRSGTPRILVVGDHWEGSNVTSMANGFADLGAEVDYFDTGFGAPRPPLLEERLTRRLSARRRARASRGAARRRPAGGCEPDLTLIYKCEWLGADALHAAHTAGRGLLAHFWPDIPFYDAAEPARRSDSASSICCSRRSRSICPGCSRSAGPTSSSCRMAPILASTGRLRSDRESVSATEPRLASSGRGATTVSARSSRSAGTAW